MEIISASKNSNLYKQKKVHKANYIIFTDEYTCYISNKNILKKFVNDHGVNKDILILAIENGLYELYKLSHCI